MKNTLLVLSLIIFTVLVAEAQKARIGLKGGLNFSNLDSDTDFDSKTGFHFGAYAEFGAAGFSIQPEVLFSTKGAKIEFDGDDLKFNLSYIEIPILLKKSFAKVLNVHVGPQFGLLTKAELKSLDVAFDVKDETKNLDISAVFGLGIDLPKGLNAGVRYALGLSEIEDPAPDDGTSIKNKTFQIYIGYKLFGK